MKWLLLCAGVLLTAPAIAQVDSSVLMKDIRTLSSDAYAGRKTGTPGSRKAQFYILDRFKEIGISAYHDSYEYPFYVKQGERNIMATNIYGYIPGQLPQAIVISAHYDHLGIGRHDAAATDSIFNGADDNASGIGGLLAIAKYFKAHPPKHTLIFLATDAEEMGLLGAKDFVEHPPVAKENMIMNLNMDMIAHNDKNELYACGPGVEPALKPYVEKVAATSDIKLIIGHDAPNTGHENWIPQSDQLPFYEAKIPFIYFGVEDHPDYHKVSDEYDRINHHFYYRSVVTILDVVRELDQNWGK
ncbi:peptidase M28-like protein [Chitinophaga dinghuensis]|uniref:Peptidase M28-like protein n=1 Tax=Chitinophaga dinghuensis TaxID=1539050 RepID=A0A327W4S8_9BACT|nr:M20/M25/M40 family metallo-hydrolase [Chitinophaga dinghuensis]RAJ85507.1 peptidase M28-like protein [Chitinophaga dinghuensis]